MAIQINTTLVSREGFNVASGGYCVLDIKINKRKFAEINILFYKDKTSFDNLLDPFTPNNSGLLQSYSRQLTDVEYQNLTVVNIHQFVQTYLETIFGVGTTTIVQ